MYYTRLRKIGETFGDRDPHSITAADVAEWVAAAGRGAKAGNGGAVPRLFKLLLDFVGVEPNPASDPRVKLPKRVTEEANPPSDDHFLAIIEKLLPRWRLFFITVEQGGLRISESGCADLGRCRRGRRAAASPPLRDQDRTVAWVQLPAWLMEAIEDTCPLEDRVPERKVFQGLNVSTARQAMTRACRLGEDPALLAARSTTPQADPLASGGRASTGTRGACRALKPSMSLDMYTHVMPVAEVSVERVLATMGR